MASLQYNATKSNLYGASASSADPYFGYQTYSYSISEGGLGNSHVVDILSGSISNANTNGGSSTGAWKMQIEVLLNGNWYALGYILVSSQLSAHQTFSNFIPTADANTKSLMGKYAPSGMRGRVIEGYFHLNAGSQIVLNATTALDYTPSTLAFSAAGVNAGEQIGVNISRMSGDLTHTVDYYFGTRHVQHTNVGVSDALTIPLEWLDQIPNSTSGTCTCVVTTLFGSTVIGSNTGYFTVSAGPNIKPSLTSLTAVGVEQYWGLYVQRKSKVQLTANGAAGIYGSSPKSIHIWGPGNDNGGANPFTSGYLQDAGNNQFFATVTDSRGRTSDPVSCTVLVTAYAPPSYSFVDAQRCDSNGTLADEGLYARCTASYQWSAIGGNSIATAIYYRETGAANWTLGNSELISNNGYKVIGGGFAIDKTYDVLFQIWDYFTGGEKVPAYDTLQTAKCTMDWLAGGNGVSFGKVATRPGVEISPDWPFYANGSRIGIPSNPNLLINGDFQVWQRGTVFTGIHGMYGPDRWVTLDSPPTAFQRVAISSSPVGLIAPYCLKITTSNDTWNIVAQPTEAYQSLEGKTVTMSLWVLIPAGKTVSYGVGNDDYNTSKIGNGEWQLLTVTRPYSIGAGYTRFKGVKVFAPPGQGIFDFYVTCVKLELGSIATPFVPRSYAEELAMCQRYYIKDFRTPMYFQTGGYWACMGAFPTQMRVEPTVTITKYGIIGAFEYPLSGHFIGKSIDGIFFLGSVSGPDISKQHYAYFSGIDAEIY